MLIGLYGYAGVGKTTFASALLKHKNGYRLSFASALKTSVKKLFEPHQYKKHEEVMPGVTYRNILVDYGEAMRNLNEHFWIHIFKKNYHSRLKSFCVIDDVRYPNEFEWIKYQGGIMVKLTRVGIEKQGAYKSEGLLDNYYFDYTIELTNPEMQAIEFIENNI